MPLRIKLEEIDSDELQVIFNNSSSMKDVMVYFNEGFYTKNYKIIKEYIEKYNIDVTTMNSNMKKYKHSYKLQPKYTYHDIFTEHSKVERCTLRSYIKRNTVLDYICKKCGNNGIWLGERLTLQIEHINGVGDDNRIENLCYLCPNCHTQTSTYAGKNIKIKKKEYKCEDCKKDTKGYGKYCKECCIVNRTYDGKILCSDKELQEFVNKYPFTYIGKLFGVSDNAIRKRCRKLGIQIPKFKPGYWNKIDYISN